jgi:hypothetical protein
MTSHSDRVAVAGALTSPTVFQPTLYNESGRKGQLCPPAGRHPERCEGSLAFWQAVAIRCESTMMGGAEDRRPRLSTVLVAMFESVERPGGLSYCAGSSTRRYKFMRRM